jgi:hypothetical protein
MQNNKMPKIAKFLIFIVSLMVIVGDVVFIAWGTCYLQRATDVCSSPKADIRYCQRYVRFGSEADMCAATSDVCFTPDSDRKSGHVPMVMSAVPPKADMGDATAYVCFGPIADMPISLAPGVVRAAAWNHGSVRWFPKRSW